MLVDIITMTAFCGAVLALVQWMAIQLVVEEEALVPSDWGDQRAKE